MWVIILILVVLSLSCAVLLAAMFFVLVGAFILLIASMLIWDDGVNDEKQFLSIVLIAGICFTYYRIVYEFGLGSGHVGPSMVIVSIVLSVCGYKGYKRLSSFASSNAIPTYMLAMIVAFILFIIDTKGIDMIEYKWRSENAKDNVKYVRTMKLKEDSGIYEAKRDIMDGTRDNYLYRLESGTVLWCDEIIEEMEGNMFNGKEKICGYKVHTNDGKIGFVVPEQVILLDYATSYDIYYSEKWDDRYEEDIYNGW